MYIGTFLLARAGRSVTLEAMNQISSAQAEVQQREAAFIEVRQDLDRVLGAGGVGHYTDHHFGDYQLGGIIGRGAMGEVYEAFHIQTGELVAAKVLAVSAARGWRSVQKLTAHEQSHREHIFGRLDLPSNCPTLLSMLPATLQFLIVMIASSINERMQKRLDYKSEEVLVLKAILRSVTGKRRIDFNESQRKRLATKGKDLTPNEREECCELVRPRTILEWFRRIYADKYDSSKSRRRPGRPRKPEETRRLVLAIANDNLSWGYTKIRDAVNVGLGIDVCRSTVANILHEAGIVPAPERDKRRTWKEFMTSHWASLYACDFFAVETLGVFGAVRHLVFFVVKLETREVHIAGIRVNPDGAWMKQIARNLTDPIDGFLRDATHLIHDADPLFTADFKAILKPATFVDSEGVESVQIPPRSPNCNPHAERFVKTIKYECLQHFVFFGQRHLRYVISEYMAHYHQERFHQGIGGSLISPIASNDNAANGEVRCKSRLGGLLNFYYREAA